MGQSITLKIAGKSHKMVASTPEQESLMRHAAEQISSMYESYQTKYPNVPVEDKMSFVALKAMMLYLDSQGRKNKVDSEVSRLEEALRNYLEKEISR